jgi:hypothetical protein
MKKAILVLLILAACGGSDGGWSEQARTDFVAGCTDNGGAEDTCKCVQEKLEARHPDLTDPADLDQDEITELVGECR